MGNGKFNAGGNRAMDWHSIQGGMQLFLVASCYRNRDKVRPDGPLGELVCRLYFLEAWAIMLNVRLNLMKRIFTETLLILSVACS